MKEFNLDGHAFIELYKILKIEGMASSGGEAKGIVATGQVLVNGVAETQKRKKNYSGYAQHSSNPLPLLGCGEGTEPHRPLQHMHAPPDAVHSVYRILHFFASSA